MSPMDGSGALFVQNLSGVTASKVRSSDDNEMLYPSSTIGAAFVVLHENRTLDHGVDPPFHRDKPILSSHYTLPSHPIIPIQLLTQKCVSIVRRMLIFSFACRT